MFGSKELDENLYSGRILGTMMFGATIRHLRRDMRLIDKLEKKKVIHHAKLGNISKTKTDLDKIIKWMRKFEDDSKDAVRGLIKFENYELGNIQNLDDFIATLEKLGFPKGIIAEDSAALLSILSALKEDFKIMREHFALLEDKTKALIRQSEARVKSAQKGMKVAQVQSKRLAARAKRGGRRLKRA
ncbi:MAG: hypothetical protein KAT43_04440 [Nanoarchaeota archaeon]|nr:hypothetical protein [Nanoarchaeota archaeon]